MKFLALILLLVLGGCYREENKQFLEKQGYTDLQFLCGYAAFSCSNDDGYSTCFTAINPAGNLVKGAVCEGWIFKNKTIRLE